MQRVAAQQQQRTCGTSAHWYRGPALADAVSTARLNPSLCNHLMYIAFQRQMPQMFSQQLAGQINFSRHQHDDDCIITFAGYPKPCSSNQHLASLTAATPCTSSSSSRCGIASSTQCSSMQLFAPWALLQQMHTVPQSLQPHSNQQAALLGTAGDVNTLPAPSPTRPNNLPPRPMRIGLTQLALPQLSLAP